MRLRQSIIDQLIQGLSDSARKFLWNEKWGFLSAGKTGR